MSTVLLEPQAMPQFNPAFHSQHNLKMPAPPARSQSLSPPPWLAVSAMGMFHVMGFAPREGEGGLPLTVYTQFTNLFPHRRVYLRIVIGQRAVATEIRRMGYGGQEAWRFEGTVPEFHTHRSSSPTVTVSIQAVDSEHTILDSVTFGEFTYWDSGISPATRSDDELHRSHTHSVRDNRARSSSLQHSVPPANLRQQPAVRPSSGTVQVLRRRDPPDEAVEGQSGPATLEFLTPLEDMAENFTEEERCAGRRLVRFSRVQDGHKLLVSCKAIRPEDYDERYVVISCIYRPSDGGCFVTSVDIIHLLQHLVQNNFCTEEKNRIRRNLEGFRPTTISKTREECEEFFQQIMDFPRPKPRNIEKDVKVFPWGVLGAALDKIINKYSLFNISPSGDDVAQPAGQVAPQYQPPDHPPVPSLASFLSSGSNTQLQLGLDEDMEPAAFDPQMHVDPMLLHEHTHHSSPSLTLPSPDSFDHASSHGSMSDLSGAVDFVGEYPPSHSAPVVPSSSTGHQDPYIGHLELNYPSFDSVDFQALREYSGAPLHSGATTYV